MRSSGQSVSHSGSRRQLRQGPRRPVISQHLRWGCSGRGSCRPFAVCPGQAHAPGTLLLALLQPVARGDPNCASVGRRDPGQRAGRSGWRDGQWHRLRRLFPELLACSGGRMHRPSWRPGSAAPFAGCRRAPGKRKSHPGLRDRPCSARPLPPPAGRGREAALQQPAPGTTAKERRDNPRLAEDSARLSLSLPPRREQTRRSPCRHPCESHLSRSCLTENQWQASQLITPGAN